MPQTMKEKRLKAIAGYESAIRSHESSLESCEFRLKGYKKSQDSGKPDPMIGEVIEAVTEQIIYEKDKITKLKGHVFHTSQAIGYVNRN